MTPSSRSPGGVPAETRGGNPAPGSRSSAAVEVATLAFEPIDLETASETATDNRVDFKYLFSIDQLAGILTAVHSHYRVLEVVGRRLSRYRTTYYDTRDLTFYHGHRTDRLPRQKVRRRDYIETRTAFLEVKETNNRSRTVKTRVPLPSGSIGMANDLGEVGGVTLPYSVPPDRLDLSLSIDYTRITLVGSEPLERVTLDLGLSATRGAATKHYPDAVIAEVKQWRAARSPFVRELRIRNIREVNLSKYCVCLAALEPRLQLNRFREDLRRLEPYEATST